LFFSKVAASALLADTLNILNDMVILYQFGLNPQ